MSVFKFTIYDFHEHPQLNEVDGDVEIIFKPDLEKDSWLKFKLAIDYNVIQVIAFRDYVIFKDDTPIKCTKVFLSDGTIVFAVWQFDTFEENLNQFKEELNKATD